MSNSANSNRPVRKTGWNTYYPWALALYVILSLGTLIIIVGSWIPVPEIPGVPASEQSFRLVPGLLGILFFVMAGRQIYLRRESQR